jgi:hypothetical protein
LGSEVSVRGYMAPLFMGHGKAGSMWWGEATYLRASRKQRGRGRETDRHRQTDRQTHIHACTRDKGMLPKTFSLQLDPTI